jgi:cyclopropane fatty-acyl-phospholipid synthase-like methyltransferase
LTNEPPKVDPFPLSPYVSAAWRRNRDPILDAMKTILPRSGDVLEVASGAGAHVAYFAPHFPEIRFQPSDCDPAMFPYIRANRDAANIANVADPLLIDLTNEATWPKGGVPYDGLIAINVFHVAPLKAMAGFAKLAAEFLKPGGVAAIYGPFKVDGRFTSPSNEAFDGTLKAQRAEWGLRDIRDFEKAAACCGIALKRRLDMPANNFILIFEA